MAVEGLRAEVEGDIEDVDGVLRITKIRLKYVLKAPAEARETVDRVLDVYARACPAYTSVQACIECRWEAVLES